MENAEQINEQFYLGKGMLDSERYVRAIEIYDHLIPMVEAYGDDFDTQVTLETSLNNRGCAKCKEALKNNNLELYESGIDDFKKSIEVSGVTEENELSMLTAWQNLQFAVNEMQDIQSATGAKLNHVAIPTKAN